MLGTLEAEVAGGLQVQDHLELLSEVKISLDNLVRSDLNTKKLKRRLVVYSSVVRKSLLA